MKEKNKKIFIRLNDVYVNLLHLKYFYTRDDGYCICLVFDDCDTFDVWYSFYEEDIYNRDLKKLLDRTI